MQPTDNIPPQELLRGMLSAPAPDATFTSTDADHKLTDDELQARAREFLRNARPLSVRRGLLPRAEGDKQLPMEIIQDVPAPIQFCMSDMPFSWILLGPFTTMLRENGLPEASVLDLFLRDHTQDVEAYTFITAYPVVASRYTDIAHTAVALTPSALESFCEFCRVSGFQVGQHIVQLGTTKLRARDPHTGLLFDVVAVSPIMEHGGWVPLASPEGVLEFPMGCAFTAEVRTTPALVTVNNRLREV